MTKNIDILSNPKGAFFKLATPLILLTLFHAGYTIVDMFWVSKISPEALFAVGVVAPLITLITGFGEAIGTGTNSIISRELGENDLKGTYNSILHAIVAGIIITAIIFISTFFLKDILRFMNITTSVDLALAYLTPMFIFSFTFLFSTLFSSTLQAEGNTRTPTILLIATNVLNLILDPILIFVFDMGISGAAYASIISALISVVYFLYWYLSGKSEVVLNFKYFKPGLVYEILVVAVPDFLMNVVWSFAMMYINRILIQQLGQLGILLYSTSIKIESLMISPQKAFGKALVTISGQLFGANKIDELKQMYAYSIKISVILVLITTLVFFFIRDYVYALFSVTNAGTEIFFIALAAFIILPCQEVTTMSNKVLDGLGKSYHSLILSLITIISEIVLVTILAPILTSGSCVLVGIITAEIVLSIVYYILVRDMLKGINKMDELIEKENMELKQLKHKNN